MELMVVLAIAAVILAIGAPSFNQFRLNNRMTGIGNDFLASIVAARSEAIKRQASVALCPTADPNVAAPDCTNGPFSAWFVFVDADGDCVRDAGDEVLRRGGPIDAEVRSASNGNCLSFGGNGFGQVVAGKIMAQRTMFCDPRGNIRTEGPTGLNSAARGVQASPTGHARVTRLYGELTSWAGGGAPVSCP